MDAEQQERSQKKKWTKRQKRIADVVVVLVLVSTIIGAAILLPEGDQLKILGAVDEGRILSPDLTNNVSVSYQWSYDGNWVLNETITPEEYDQYHDRGRSNDLASYVTPDDPLIKRIANELKNAAENESDGGTV